MSFRKMKVGELILAEIVEIGRTYLVEPHEWVVPHGDDVAYRAPRSLRVPVKLTAFLRRLGAREIEHSFLIVRESADRFYIDANQDDPGNGKRYVLRGGESLREIG